MKFRARLNQATTSLMLWLKTKKTLLVEHSFITSNTLRIHLQELRRRKSALVNFGNALWTMLLNQGNRVSSTLILLTNTLTYLISNTCLLLTLVGKKSSLLTVTVVLVMSILLTWLIWTAMSIGVGWLVRFARALGSWITSSPQTISPSPSVTKQESGPEESDWALPVSTTSSSKQGTSTGQKSAWSSWNGYSLQ